MTTEATTAPVRTVQAESAPRGEATRAPERFVTPRVDIHETKEGLQIAAELPGAAKDSISVVVNEDVLTIEGRIEPSWQGAYTHREWGPTAYFRQFAIGERLDRTRIHAEWKHGVLHLRLPFAEAAKPRQIAIQVA